MSEITTTVSKGRSFWDKPEGLWGMCLAAILVGAFVWFMTWFVPMILMLGLGILGVGIVWGTIVGLAALVFTDNPLKGAFVLKFQIFCRKLRSSVINEDPIAVRRLIQSRARERWEDFKKLGAPVKAAKASVKDSADRFQQMLDRAQSLYNIKTRENAPQDEVEEVLTQIGVLQREVGNMQKLANETEIMDATLDEAGRRIKKVIDKAQFEIDIAETRMKAVAAVSSSWKKLRSVFSPTSKEEDLRLEAERASEEKYHAELGQIDQCMTEFKDVLKSLNDNDKIDAETARRKMASLRTQVVTLQALPDETKPSIVVVPKVVSRVPTAR